MSIISKKNELSTIQSITNYLENIKKLFVDKFPVISDKFRIIHENMTYKIKNKSDSVKVIDEYLNYLNNSDNFKNKENLGILRKLLKENFSNSDNLNEIFNTLEYSGFINKSQALKFCENLSSYSVNINVNNIVLTLFNII